MSQFRVRMAGHANGITSGDGWFYDFGDSYRAFKRDCTVYTGYNNTTNNVYFVQSTMTQIRIN